jgi:outer membrane lipase/esterase
MRLHTLFFAATLVASSATAFADPITRLFVFGDSVSDNGNLAALSGGTLPAPPYAPGRASDGPVAVEYLSQALGLGPLVPAAAGGTNFAVIGAATGSVPLPGLPGMFADNIGQVLGFPLPPTGMSNAQLAQFFMMNPGPIDPSALFVIWGGPNDLLINPSAATAVAAATNIGLMIDTLYGAGARNFLVPNMADLGLAPGASNPDVSLLALVFNAALAGQLDVLDATRPGIDITRFDTFGFFNTVVASPETYGFTNVEDECYVGPLLGMGDGAGTVCQTPNSYLFWDGTHPSAAAHRILGAEFAAAVQPEVVPEPLTMTLASLGAAAVVLRRRRAA